MKIAKIQTTLEVEGGEAWTVQIMVIGPKDTARDLEPIKAEIVKRLPSWVKSKIEKG